MAIDALDRFRTEFRRWVVAHNAANGFNSVPDTLLTNLESRIPSEYLTRIGSAYLNGWLSTESEPSRGYFVREADRPGLKGGQYTLIHRGDGTVDPCWELYVQLADYAWLRTIAPRYGHYVRLEDNLMDLTIRAGKTLVLYVEQKTTKSLAERLVDRVREYGRTGFSLDSEDKGNDPLRKAKYLVRSDARPLFFGVSAIDFKQLFRVEYSEGNKFDLHEDNRTFASILADNPSTSETAITPRNPIDALAIEIERLCPECWVSVGSGQTAYNFYVPADGTNAVVLGVYDNGDIWTDVMRIGKERAARLSAALSESNVELVTNKTWSFWKRDGKKLNVADVDPTAVGGAIRNALRLDVSAGGHG